MSLKKDAQDFLQSQYGNSGIKGLLQLMQMNYTMRNVPALVTANGNEVNIDFQGREMIDAYHSLTTIVASPNNYSPTTVQQAKVAIEKMKSDLSQGKPQTKQDRDMFINARVNKLSFSIGGKHIISVPIA